MKRTTTTEPNGNLRPAAAPKPKRCSNRHPGEPAPRCELPRGHAGDHMSRFSDPKNGAWTRLYWNPTTLRRMKRAAKEQASNAAQGK